jgi:hypothetical protein
MSVKTGIGEPGITVMTSNLQWNNNALKIKVIKKTPISPYSTIILTSQRNVLLSNLNPEINDIQIKC